MFCKKAIMAASLLVTFGNSINIQSHNIGDNIFDALTSSFVGFLAYKAMPRAQMEDYFLTKYQTGYNPKYEFDNTRMGYLCWGTICPPFLLFAPFIDEPNKYLYKTEADSFKNKLKAVRVATGLVATYATYRLLPYLRNLK